MSYFTSWLSVQLPHFFLVDVPHTYINIVLDQTCGFIATGYPLFIIVRPHTSILLYEGKSHFTNTMTKHKTLFPKDA